MDRICKLDILAPAQAELEEIARVHMALSGPRSAQEITDKIYDAMEQLTRFPLSGPPSGMSSCVSEGIAISWRVNIW